MVNALEKAPNKGLIELLLPLLHLWRYYDKSLKL